MLAPTHMGCGRPDAVLHKLKKEKQRWSCHSVVFFFLMPWFIRQSLIMCWRNGSDPSEKETLLLFSLFLYSVGPTEQSTFQSTLFVHQNTRGERIPQMCIPQNFSEVNYEIHTVVQWAITHGEVFIPYISSIQQF